MQPMFTKTIFFKNQTGWGMGEVEGGGYADPGTACALYYILVLCISK